MHLNGVLVGKGSFGNFKKKRKVVWYTIFKFFEHL